VLQTGNMDLAGINIPYNLLNKIHSIFQGDKIRLSAQINSWKYLV